MSSTLRSLVGQPLTWKPTAALKARYDLVGADNTPLATLDMSTWTSKAHAQVPEGNLFMHKEGLTGLKVAIYAAEQGPLVATYQHKLIGNSGVLTFSDGREFKWGKANFLGTRKVWKDATGKTAYVQLSMSRFSRKSNVIIHPQAAEVADLSLLVVLGLYNIVVEKRKAAAEGAALAVFK